VRLVKINFFTHCERGDKRTEIYFVGEIMCCTTKREIIWRKPEYKPIMFRGGLAIVEMRLFFENARLF
jgi:hypothetical protein